MLMLHHSSLSSFMLILEEIYIMVAIKVLEFYLMLLVLLSSHSEVGSHFTSLFILFLAE